MGIRTLDQRTRMITYLIRGKLQIRAIGGHRDQLHDFRIWYETKPTMRMELAPNV